MHKRLLLCLFLTACSVEEGPSSTVKATEKATSLPTVLSVEFEPRIREIATQFREQFRNWTKLGTVPNMAPLGCRQPPLVQMLSKSRDKGTHGRKLYFLYVKEALPYYSVAENDQPIGQALVKESFEAIPITLEEKSALDKTDASQTVSKDGEHWRLGPPRDLFVMYKLDPATPNTDEGWVYGTSSLDLEVSSAGRVASCMECHIDATRDRMFGKQ